MKKSLPKLKKTVKSFLVEEDAKLINKTASKIALTTAFTSTIALINIESGNAFLDGHNNHTHTNHLELPTNNMVAPADVPKYSGDFIGGGDNSKITYNPYFLNLGEYNDIIAKESFQINYDYESQTTYNSGPRGGSTTSYIFEINYPDSSAENGVVTESITISGSSSTYSTTIGTSGNDMNFEINIENSDYSASGYRWSGTSGYGNLEEIEFTLDSNSQTLSNVELDSSGSVKFNNIDTIEIPAETPKKTIKAEHANHYNHSNDGGLFGTSF